MRGGVAAAVVAVVAETAEAVAATAELAAAAAAATAALAAATVDAGVGVVGPARSREGFQLAGLLQSRGVGAHARASKVAGSMEDSARSKTAGSGSKPRSTR